MARPEKKSDKTAMDQVTERYAVSVTTEVMETITDHNDAVAKQYMPDVAELIQTPDELMDPIGDNLKSPVKGVIHRYPDRVLLTPVHVCAVYCRFCFRREKVGPGQEMLTEDEFDTALDYIRENKGIWEIILTGGDPLVLSPRRMTAIMEKINMIEHVKIVRLHTRVPIANPTRVTSELISAIKTSTKTVYAVLHCNHAQELTDKVQAAVDLFVGAGIPLLSQSTLLKGVNDDTGILEQLFRKLTEMKVKPYYLHHPDKVTGTSHFRLPLRVGQKIVRALWGKMSGIAQPTYILDIPKGFGKTRADSPHVSMDGNDYLVTDYKGVTHAYQDTKE